MPIYEYRCGSCSHELDALQKLSDSPLRKCPECGRLTLRRLISAPVFRLKGGGWYETDFKGNGEKKRNLVETGGGDSSESSSSSSDSAKDSASKEASAKVAEAKSSDSADKKPKPEKTAPQTAKKSASKRKLHAKKSARA